MQRYRRTPQVIVGLKEQLAAANHHLDDVEIDPSDDLNSLVSLFADIRDRQEQVKRLSAKLAKLSDELSFEILPSIFERTNTVSPYNHVRGKFTLATRTNASIKEGCKETAFDWLEANNLDGIIIRTIPWQTLGATAADLQKEGRELPSDYFEVSSRVYTRFTPAKGGE
jgi:transcriptional accessory protein Tex/SPT6